MKKIFNILMILSFVIFFTNCKELFPGNDDGGNNNPEAETTVVSSNESGELTTASGIRLEIPQGAVPANENGDAGSVTFSIESPAELPQPFTGGEVVGQAVRLGPENFNFAWPLLVGLSYDDNVENPEELKVVYFDATTNQWVYYGISSWDQSNKKFFFNTLKLGVFCLVRVNTENKSLNNAKATDDNETAHGILVFKEQEIGTVGFMGIRDDAVVTIVNVFDYKYPEQGAYWGSTPIGWSWGTGTFFDSGRPAAMYVPQATYVIAFSILIHTIDSYYTQVYSKFDTVVVDKPNTTWGCNQGSLSCCACTDPNRAEIHLPPGGEWVNGYLGGPGCPSYSFESNWDAPTVTYGTGDFQATLTWANNSVSVTDYDLHLYGPDDMHVYFGNKVSSTGTFKLDRDWISELGSAVENIYSVNNSFPSGEYRVTVHLFSSHSGTPNTYHLRVIDGAEVQTYSGVINYGDDEREVTLYTFNK